MTRIRYKNVNGTLVSGNIIAGKTVVVVTISADVPGHFYVTDMETQAVVAQGTGDSSQTLKIKAKRALRELGAVFQDEVRKPFVPTDTATEAA